MVDLDLKLYRGRWLTDSEIILAKMIEAKQLENFKVAEEKALERKILADASSAAMQIVST